jgi:hypothetical protein
MDVWGVSSFENCDAIDWSSQLEKCVGFSMLDAALKLNFDCLEVKDSNLEIAECRKAIAAADVVVAVFGRARDSLPEAVLTWVNTNVVRPPSSIKSIALSTVNHILSDDSLLFEFWEVSDEFEKWRDDVDEIRLILEDS